MKGMSNKKSLKKHIHRVCGQAAVEVLQDLPVEIAHKAVVQLAVLQSGALAKVSFSFDHSRRDFANKHAYNKARTLYVKAAYDKLKSDFNKDLQKIVSEINSNLSDNDRQANKEKAND